MLGKSRFFILTCFIVILLVMATGCQKEGEPSEGTSASVEAETAALINDFRAQADDRVQNAKDSKPQAADAVPSASSQGIEFPSVFDLRSVDTDGNGEGFGRRGKRWIQA